MENRHQEFQRKKKMDRFCPNCLGGFTGGAGSLLLGGFGGLAGSSGTGRSGSFGSSLPVLEMTSAAAMPTQTASANAQRGQALLPSVCGSCVVLPAGEVSCGAAPVQVAAVGVQQDRQQEVASTTNLRTASQPRSGHCNDLTALHTAGHQGTGPADGGQINRAVFDDGLLDGIGALALADHAGQSRSSSRGV